MAGRYFGMTFTGYELLEGEEVSFPAIRVGDSVVAHEPNTSSLDACQSTHLVTFFGSPAAHWRRGAVAGLLVRAGLAGA